MIKSPTELAHETLLMLCKERMRLRFKLKVVQKQKKFFESGEKTVVKQIGVLENRINYEIHRNPDVLKKN